MISHKLNNNSAAQERNLQACSVIALCNVAAWRYGLSELSEETSVYICELMTAWASLWILCEESRWNFSACGKILAHELKIRTSEIE